MIKTIIFDNGGVLVSGNEDGVYQLFSSAYNTNKRDVKIEYDWCAKRLDSGELTSREFYKKLEEIFGVVIPYEVIKDEHRNAFVRKEDVIAYAKSLKEHYGLALLSNFGDYFDEFNQDWKLEELFDRDKMFVSYKLGLTKPGKEIYMYALRKLGRKPEEAVFIDDRLQNIETARSLGMNVVQFKSAEQLKTDLEKILKKNEK
jgi:5-amino-6-(5-phospho-D-ribitylamino)uracil phosphatase